MRIISHSGIDISPLGFHTSSILRTQGRSVTAAAAYISASKLEDTYTGQEYDFRRKWSCEHKEILLPPNAPDCYSDWQRLCTEISWQEVSPSGRTARIIEFSLPVELNKDQWVELARDYIQQTFVDEGMIAAWVIHNPPARNDQHIPIDKNGEPTNDRTEMTYNNPHVHCILTVRPIGKDGKFEAKSQKEYVCKNVTTGEERPLIASEFVSLRQDGFEKEYRYEVDGKRVWLTPSEVAPYGLKPSDRVFKNPRSTLRGRENPKCAEWNSEETLRKWREGWAEAVNRKFESLGMSERIDHRNFVDRGIEAIPQVHLGPKAAHAYKGRSDRAAMNEEIRQHNGHARQSQNAKEEIQHQIQSKARELHLIRTRAAADEAGYAAASLAALAIEAERRRLNELEIAEREIEAADALNDAALSVIEELLQALETAGSVADMAADVMLSKINKERQDIETRRSYIKDILKRTGCKAKEELAAEIASLRQKLSSASKSDTASDNPRNRAKWKEQYAAMLDSVPPALRPELQEAQEQLNAASKNSLSNEFDEQVLKKVDAEIAGLKNNDQVIGKSNTRPVRR